MINKLFILLIYLSGLAIFNLEASLEQYFKKPTDKKSCKTIRNIDFIYMINLDQRPEKFNQSLKQLSPYGIVPYRFSAVNGWEQPLEVINDVGVKLETDMYKGFWGSFYSLQNQGRETHEIIQQIGRTYFGHCMARGAIGIVLSHLSVLQDAYDSGYETIWVMEDDIEVVKDPRSLSNLIDKLDKATGKQGWDVFFTDQDTRNKKGNYVVCNQMALRPNFKSLHKGIFRIHKNFTYDFRLIGARYGAYSMIVRRSGMKKILDFFKTYNIFLPYDMDFYVAPGIKMYTVQEDIVSSLIDSLSDNGGAFYLQSEETVTP